MVSIDMGDIENNIMRTIADVDGKLRRSSGKKAGHSLADALAKNTPVDNVGKVLLEDTATVSAVQEDGTLEVGYGRQAYFRAHVVNMGTEFQRGQHFIEKTVETEAENVMKSYMEDLKRGLNL